jgi:predicted enzyme related to lactoylglutathione lyase
MMEVRGDLSCSASDSRDLLKEINAVMKFHFSLGVHMRYRLFAAAIVLSILSALAIAEPITSDSSNPSDNGGGQKTLSRVTGIGGVFLKAKNPAKLGAWYKKHLGIDVQAWGGAKFRWVDTSGQPMIGTTAWSVGDGKNFAPSTAPFMVNYRVSDLRALLAALRSEGCEVLDKTDESEYGKFGWVMDPEGNKVELWQPPAGK